MRTVSERLAVFAAGTDASSVPEAVQTRARDCVIHALVVGAAGAGIGFGETARQALDGIGGTADAHLLTSGDRAPAQIAAFANSVLLHARAQEDTHGTFHPGIVTIPAALAATESVGGDGRTFLSAVIAGYEVGTALSEPLTELTTPPFRATGIFGPLAAAAAAGRALGLDAARMTSALGLAAAFAGGSSEPFAAGSDEWHYQSGMAAAAGVLAAQLARAGAYGSAHAIEGEAGFLSCFVQGTRPNPDELATELGRRWRILDVTFKPYPICAFNQVPAIVAANLATEYAITTADVRSLVVRMNEREGTYPGVGYPGPFREVAQTLMSVRFCVAAAFVYGHIDYRALRRFDEPAITALMERIDVVPERARPPQSASVTLTTREGRIHELAIDAPGEALSWSSAAIRDNARRLRPETPWTEAHLESLFSAVDELGSTPSLARLVDAALIQRR